MIRLSFVPIVLLIPALLNAQLQPVKSQSASLPTSAAGAPVGTRAHISPIPLYFPSTVSGPELATQFVFLEPNTWDLVLSFPANIDNPDFARNPGPRVERHVSLKNHTQPFLFVAFDKDSAGNHIYEYSLFNRGDARQPIRSWALHVPFRGNPPSSTSSANALLNGSPLLHGASPWPASTSVPSPDVVAVVWSASAPATYIAPGASGNGFGVSSPLLPGFIDASVEGPGAQLDQMDVPNKVKTQLTALESAGFNAQKVLTIGPRFEPDAPRIAIAIDFAHGIDVLVRNGYLDANAPFVSETSQMLHAYIGGAEFAPDVPAREYIGPPIEIRAIPAAGLESQIYRAMKISLEIP